jgi:hypothetical protein
VDRAVKAHPEGLTVVARFTAKGQPSGTLYTSGSFGSKDVPKAETGRDER